MNDVRTGPLEISPPEELIEEIRQGRMVVLMDDVDRENEGDLVMAAEKVTPDAINFMARYGRGLVCLTLTADRCRQLDLPLMVADTNERAGTNFTVSIEAAQGVTTGISAADRARTVLAAVKQDAGPKDIVMPGHIFPLRAQPGGVLARAGHTEAGCDLARLAGCEPAAVIVEILNDDGTMARLPQLQAFARRHGLKLGTIADLIRYRVQSERSVEWVTDTRFQSEFGTFRLVVFHDVAYDEAHLALTMGRIQADEPTLVRVQAAGLLRDVLGGAPPGTWTIRREHIVREVQAYRMRHLGTRLPGSGRGPDLRKYGVGAQILSQLGVRRMRVMDRPRKLHGLAGFGLELVDFVQPQVPDDEPDVTDEAS
jgi:3,4-dihydroxy 2-butanone 4-phosphate synthase / GTP cyclohydrolase II